ncbi:MAG: hypothetical protein ALECFALPRED_007334 [Alectoria fallacina]|uniref:Uncharacterized protein n=1 Tax=Alectoria fallacina TaxID=1903189 RepID=A0A8H3ETM8_9LECA|nr:MAG: hypothetical protein ALECFALPRED_007334 [Alectoria fallacina]
MSSSQTHQASSNGVYDDSCGCLLDQTSACVPQNSIGSLQNDWQMALTLQSSDRDLSIEKQTRLERNRGQVVTLDSRPAGRLCEPGRRIIGPENTKKSRALFRSEHNLSSHGSRANPAEVLAVEHTNPAARAPPNSKYTSSNAVASSQLPCPNGTAKAPLVLRCKSLGHQFKANSRDSAHLAAAVCKELQEQMMRIPAEICQVIMDMVFKEAFGTRRVRPHKDPPIMNIFLALDKEFYRKFHEQYWVKNTWVVAKGPLNKTMRFMTERPYNETTTEFSLQTPNKAALQIQSIELSFSNADTPHLSEWRQLAEESAVPHANPSHVSPFTTTAPNGVQTLQIAQRSPKHAQRYDEIQRQLIHTWQDKFDRIAMLNLKHLTLDFTEAYDPDGLYLGVYIVRRLIPFAHRMPADFRILAPDIWTERQIRDAFIVLNAA